MTSPGPLIALFSQFDQRAGVLPPEILVEAAADAGYRAAALMDRGTLGGAPEFVSACRNLSMTPLLGLSARVTDDESRGGAGPIDVLEWGEESESRKPEFHRETIGLLAMDRIGYGNLLALAERGANDWPVSDLLTHSEGLVLILGEPGSHLEAVVSGHCSWRRVAWLLDLLEGWPKGAVFFGGLGGASTDGELGKRLTRIASLPGAPPPIAMAWAAYRNQSDRFWGLARAATSGGRVHIGEDLILINSDEVMRRLEGFSSSLRQAAKVLRREKEIANLFRCAAPDYPCPRGTDVATLFWTLGQETAIETGHIRTPQAKDRLYEEFQYFKQTNWPNILLALWDWRRRLGIPPGTFKPNGHWVGSSLFAHLLGISRIDPLRADMPFQAEALQETPTGGLAVELIAPHEIRNDLYRLAENLWGSGRVAMDRLQDADLSLDWERAGRRLLPHWEELGFPGDKPTEPPPIPAFLSRQPPESQAHSYSLIASALDLRVLAESGADSNMLQIRREVALRLGALVFDIEELKTLTLACCSFFRRRPESPLPSDQDYESVSDWMEQKRGDFFLGKAYADDTGPFDLLSRSSSLLRLLSLPGSLGYRPLLWWILHENPVLVLKRLAHLLALCWHFSFWSDRPERRLKAIRRKDPLEAATGPPPWWEEWERFVEESSLDSSRRARLGAALEKATMSTGGWLLYLDQMDSALGEALPLSPEERRLWLRVDLKDAIPLAQRKESKDVWTDSVRIPFLEFIGHPYPLPTRAEFLRKSEDLLMNLDAYSSDPASWVAASAALHQEGWEDRREVYKALQYSGVQVEIPRLPSGHPLDTSPSKHELVLGLRNVLGVGPAVAAELHGKQSVTLGDGLLTSLFESPIEEPSPSWRDWLESRSARLLSLPLLTRLIDLGACERFGLPRDSLLRVAKSVARKRLPPLPGRQGTLFHLQQEGIPEPSFPAAPASDIDVEPAKRKQWRIEWDALGFPVTASPLDEELELLPAKWKSKDPPGAEDVGILFGWTGLIDMLPSSAGEGPETAEPGVFISFLLFSPGGMYRIVDRHGILLPTVPIEISDDLRLDGRRIHLNEPWSVVLEVSSPKSQEGRSNASFDVISGEPLSKIREYMGEWSAIRIVFSEPTHELLTDLDSVISVFEGGGESVSLNCEISEGAKRRGALRRLMKRISGRRVMPSKTLISRMSSIPGVGKVEVVMQQGDFFA